MIFNLIMVMVMVNFMMVRLIWVILCFVVVVYLGLKVIRVIGCCNVMIKVKVIVFLRVIIMVLFYSMLVVEFNKKFLSLV